MRHVLRRKDVYLDGAADTPIDPAVRREMEPYLSKSGVGNSFAIHSYGITNGIAVEKARYQIAEDIGCRPEEVFFTSGATEGNNWVIKELALAELSSKKRKKRMHIICGATEHSSVINACKQVENWGFSVTYLVGTGSDGKILGKDVRAALREDTLLVCAMAVNNETGVANDSSQIAMYAKRNGSLTLIDCTQALSEGGESLCLTKRFMYGDFFSFSAHKIYGPGGIGCLIMMKDVQKRLPPLLSGGAQERGLRAGTVNVAGVIGMAKAIDLMRHHDYRDHFAKLVSYMIDKENNSGIFELNAFPDCNSILSLNFSKSCDSDKLAEDFSAYGVAVSAGSACDSEHDETAGDFNPSHVLASIGLIEKEVRNTVRVSLTKYTTEKDIKRFLVAAHKIAAFYAKLKTQNGEARE